MRQNNFDLLRLVFASMVLVAHTYDLSGRTSPVSSALAVNAFFVISGFLIFMSYERSSSIASYAKKRFLRIYPAYFAVVMLGALILTVEYFSEDWFKYLAANLLFLNFLHPTLPGVFADNPVQAVNGALWTLKIEVMFYAAVPLLAFLIRRWGFWVIVILYGGSLIYAATMPSPWDRQLPGQLSYFLAGAAIYYHLPTFKRFAPYLLIAAVPGLFWSVTEPAALGVVVIFAGLYFYLGNFGRYGDFSYGVYIIHFPVIQCLVPLNLPYPMLLTLALLITVSGAFLLWHLVEKRFLFRSSHYLQASVSSSSATSKGQPSSGAQ